MSLAGHRLGDGPAGRRRSGERQPVDPGQHRFGDILHRAGHQLPQIARKARFNRELAHEHSRKDRLRIGLVDDRVAGDERGDEVVGAQGQRIVPRRDEPDDPERRVIDLGAGQPGHSTAPARRAQCARGGKRGESADVVGVEHLVVGVLAGLAGLGLDDVEEQLLAAPDQIVQGEEHCRALTHTAGSPRCLRA